MPLTDGFVTDKTADDWKFINSGSALDAKNGLTFTTAMGGSVNPLGDAYVRVAGDWTPGKASTWDGNCTAGDTVDFSSPQTLLSQIAATPLTDTNPDAAVQTLFVAWAGVHPDNLNVVYVVWSQEVRLLRPDAMLDYGVINVAVVGRLMTLTLAQPLAIDGSTTLTLTIPVATVGFPYKTTSTLIPNLNKQVGQVVLGNLLVDGLEMTQYLTSYESKSVTETAVAANPEKRSASTGFSPTPTLGEAAQASIGELVPRLAFIANHPQKLCAISVVRPYSLVPVYTNCGQAKVWQVSYDIHGTVLPQRCFNTQNLLAIDTDAFSPTLFGSIKEAPVGCYDPVVEVQTPYGPTLEITCCKGEMDVETDEYQPGQVVQLDICGYCCDGSSGNPGKPAIIQEKEVYHVWDEVAKFRPRVLPVTKLTEVTFIATNVVVPVTSVTGVAVTAVTNTYALTDVGLSYAVTAITTQTGSFLTAITKTSQQLSTTSIKTITDPVSKTVDCTPLPGNVAIMPNPSFGKYDTTTIQPVTTTTTSIAVNCTGHPASLEYCDSGGTPVPISVVTAITCDNIVVPKADLSAAITVLKNSVVAGTDFITSVTPYTNVSLVTGVDCTVDVPEVGPNVTVATGQLEACALGPCLLSDVTPYSGNAITHVNDLGDTFVDVWYGNYFDLPTGTTNVVVPIGAATVSVIKEDAAGNIKLLSINDDGDISIILKPTDLVDAARDLYSQDGCNFVPAGSTVTPDVEGDWTVHLGRPVYTYKEPNNYTCPCYIGDETSNPEPNIELGANGSLEACSVRIQRLKRKFCRTC